ncbi:MAG: ribonucleoside-diphosphate reductase, adenosylcobalamin-dependent, partial [Planctomycetes bacterium]|nr:ribonucleoside-diphosphate reductase, adenosylcobalamin-dependent [Planctomycetota bacterium]
HAGAALEQRLAQVTGLADTFAMLGLRYGSPASLEVAEQVMRTVRDTAYDASVDLAIEKGAFPMFDGERYLEGEFVRQLPEELRERIRAHGIRNSHLVSIAPTGTISLFERAGADLRPALHPAHTQRHGR